MDPRTIAHTNMLDAVELARDTERAVCEGDQRRYRRFRAARFYGGISTADCIGCCLRCVFCWSWHEVVRPDGCGRLCSPDEVAKRLVEIARGRGFKQVRISGNEPAIGRDHLLGVLRRIPREYLFILETNGIPIGHDEGFAQELSRFPNIYVRVSLKGASEEEFSRLTGASPEGFGLQLKALENLDGRGVRVHPSCMVSFSSAENVADLRRRLREIRPGFEDFEVEELVLYRGVEDRLRRLGIRYSTSHTPECIPPEQI